MAVVAVVAALAIASTAQAVTYVRAPGGLAWRITDSAFGDLGSGSIHDVVGANGPFDGFGYLRVDVTRAGGTGARNAYVDDLGLQFDGAHDFRTTAPRAFGGVVVQRAISVPPGQAYVRYVDSFSNPGRLPATVKVAFGGSVGYGLSLGVPQQPYAQSLQQGTSIARTGSGDRTLDAADAWAVFAHTGAGDPETGTSYRGPSAVVLGEPARGVLTGFGDSEVDPFRRPYPGRSPEFVAARYAMSLPARATRTLVTYVATGVAENGTTIPSGSETAQVRGVAQALSAEPDFAGMTDGQLCTMANWPTPATVSCAGLQVTAPRAPEPPVPATTQSRFEVVDADLDTLRKALTSGKTSAEELTRAYLDRIRAYDRQGPGLRSYISVNPRAIDDARRLDAERAAGHVRGPLHGIPVAIKDNIDVDGLETTFGSFVFEGFKPDADSFQVKKLRDAGVVFLGKTALGELGMSQAYARSSNSGVVRNAYDPARAAGSSSGGSGVATAASLAAFTLGTDSQGSTRAPASLNNAVAFLPTFGLSSTGDVTVAPDGSPGGGGIGASIRNRIAPITRTVRDMAYAMDATYGTDPESPDTVGADAGKPDLLGALRTDALRGRRIGVWIDRINRGGGPGVPTAPSPVFGNEHQQGVIARIQHELRAEGATLVGANVPAEVQAKVLAAGEPNSLLDAGVNGYLARHPNAPVADVAEMFTSPLLTPDLRAAPGTVFTPATFAEYRDVVAKRLDAADTVETWMQSEHIDALMIVANDGGVPLNDSVRGLDFEARMSAFTGLPQIVLPGGFDAIGMPFGFGLLGRRGDDAALFGYAYDYEQATRHRRAPVAVPALAFSGEPARGPLPGETKPDPPAVTTTAAPGPATTILLRDVPGTVNLTVALAATRNRVPRGRTIRFPFVASRATTVTLTVSRHGRRVRRLTKRLTGAGRSSIAWKVPRAIPAGAYTVSLTARASGQQSTTDRAQLTITR